MNPRCGAGGRETWAHPYSTGSQPMALLVVHGPSTGSVGKHNHAAPLPSSTTGLKSGSPGLLPSQLCLRCSIGTGLHLATSQSGGILFQQLLGVLLLWSVGCWSAQLLVWIPPEGLGSLEEMSTSFLFQPQLSYRVPPSILPIPPQYFQRGGGSCLCPPGGV